jgi:Zn-dependent protease with chaperone function
MLNWVTRCTGAAGLPIKLDIYIFLGFGPLIFLMVFFFNFTLLQYWIGYEMKFMVYFFLLY